MSKLKKKDTKQPIEEKKEWKKVETASFLTSLTSLCFTDEDKDLVSNDFCLEKEKEKEKPKKRQPRKKKLEELEKPKEDETYELNDQQKQIVKKNSIIKERLLAVDKILELFPNLKKDKRLMINHVLGKQEAPKKDYILEKLDSKQFKNKSIYKDSYGNLMDADVNLIGFWTEQTGPDKKTQNIFNFFDDIKKIKTRTTKNKNKINLAYISTIKKNKDEAKNEIKK